MVKTIDYPKKTLGPREKALLSTETGRFLTKHFQSNKVQKLVDKAVST